MHKLPCSLPTHSLCYKLTTIIWLDATICRGSYGTGMPRYLPTVASFVPNMPLGSPLKISIHSWEAPIACPETGTLALQADWIWFEARVLLDGIHIA